MSEEITERVIEPKEIPVDLKEGPRVLTEEEKAVLENDENVITDFSVRNEDGDATQ